MLSNLNKIPVADKIPALTLNKLSTRFSINSLAKRGYASKAKMPPLTVSPQIEPANIKDVEFTREFFPAAGRHKVYEGVLNGKYYVFKNVRLSCEYPGKESLSQRMATFRAGMVLAEANEPVTEEELKFRAEIEMFAGLLGSLFSGKAHVPEEHFTAIEEKDDGTKEYWIVSSYIEGYKSIADIMNEGGGDNIFNFGNDGKTYLSMNGDESKKHHVVGLKAALYFLNLIGESDTNPENIGIDEEKRISIIDPELAFRYSSRFHEVLRVAKNLVSGNFKTPFEEMNIGDPKDNPKNKHRIENIRFEAISTIANGLMDYQNIYDAFNQSFSRDYSKGYKEVIAETLNNFHTKGTSFLIAHRLVVNGYKAQYETKEENDNVADEILKNVYGNNWKLLEKHPEKIYEIEKNLLQRGVFEKPFDEQKPKVSNFADLVEAQRREADARAQRDEEVKSRNKKQGSNLQQPKAAMFASRGECGR